MKLMHFFDIYNLTGKFYEKDRFDIQLSVSGVSTLLRGLVILRIGELRSRALCLVLLLLMLALLRIGKGHILDLNDFYVTLNVSGNSMLTSI